MGDPLDRDPRISPVEGDVLGLGRCRLTVSASHWRAGEPPDPRWVTVYAGSRWDCRRIYKLADWRRMMRDPEVIVIRRGDGAPR